MEDVDDAVGHPWAGNHGGWRWYLPRSITRSFASRYFRHFLQSLPRLNHESYCITSTDIWSVDTL